MRANAAGARIHAVAILVIALSLTAPAQAAETLTGKVVKVADGDTLTLLVGTEQIRVRLWGIDAPEGAQAFGNRAKQGLSGKVFGRVVQVDDRGKDKYGRTLGIIRLGDININVPHYPDGSVSVRGAATRLASRIDRLSTLAALGVGCVRREIRSLGSTRALVPALGQAGGESPKFERLQVFQGRRVDHPDLRTGVALQFKGDPGAIR
jgi:hypothetical protein